MSEAGQIGGPHLDAIFPVYFIAGFAAKRIFRLSPMEILVLGMAWEAVENSKIGRSLSPWSRPDTARDSLIELIMATIGGTI